MDRLLRLSFNHDGEAVAELGFCGWKFDTWVVCSAWLGGALLRLWILCDTKPTSLLMLLLHIHTVMAICWPARGYEQEQEDRLWAALLWFDMPLEVGYMFSQLLSPLDQPMGNWRLKSADSNYLRCFFICEKVEIGFSNCDVIWKDGRTPNVKK